MTGAPEPIAADGISIVSNRDGEIIITLHDLEFKPVAFAKFHIEAAERILGKMFEAGAAARAIRTEQNLKWKNNGR